MSKINIKGSYIIPKLITIDKEIELNLSEYLYEYIKEYTISSKENLEDAINEYILWDNLNFCFNSEEDYMNNYYDEEFEITNLEELVEEFSYLIPIKKELICCEEALLSSKFYNYCPICGNKIR